MIAAIAPRAAAQGPSGFSLALIQTPPTGAYGNSCAYASMGSVTTRNASAADAAVETCRNDLREKDVSLPWCAIKIGRASCRERCRSRWSPYHYKKKPTLL